MSNLSKLTRSNPNINDSEPGYYQRRGTFQGGGVVETATSIIFDSNTSAWYRYVGSSALPLKVNAGTSVTSDWQNVGDGSLTTRLVNAVCGLTFAKGGVAKGHNDFVLDEASNTWYFWSGQFPKTIDANSTPSDPLWVVINVGDARANLKAFAFIDSFSSLVGSDGDWTAAINAAFATGKPVVGNGTYKVSGILNSKGQKIIGNFTIDSSRYSLGKITAATVEPDIESIRMLYLESAYDLAELLYIKGLGFNTINHYCYFPNNGTIDAAGTAEQLLNNALTAGLKVNLGTESDRAKASLSEFVNATKDHPTVFGYSVYDEPAARAISIADQDTKITALRALTSKNLNFVDLLVNQPFNQVFSQNYDLAFVDSYSVRYTTGTASDWLAKDLSKMRYDFGGIKAMTGLKCIPVIAAFLDAGSAPYYSNNEAQVIAASKIFAKVAEGNFGAFVWDGASANFPGTVRTNANIRAMLKDLTSQRKRKELVTDVYIFGGVKTSTIWPLDKILKSIGQRKDPANTTDQFVADTSNGNGAWPTRVRTSQSGDPTTETDHFTQTANVDYSGIGFKGAFSSFLTSIKARKNQRVIMEIFNTIGGLNGYFRLFSTDDGGYKIVLRYEDAVSANKVLDFNNTMPDGTFDENLILRVENSGDNSTVYRKFLRGLIVCCDW